MTCNNMADVLWNKKNLREGANSIAEPSVSIRQSMVQDGRRRRPIANLGMFINDAGHAARAQALLEKALTLGAESDQAKFVRDQVAKFGR